jgi:hypothetical protein
MGGKKRAMGRKAADKKSSYHCVIAAADKRRK